MRLKNKTSLPDDLVREVIRFVRPPNTRVNEVVIRNAGKDRSGSGKANAGLRRRVRVWLPRASSKSCRDVWEPRKAYLGMVIGSRVECLVMLLAHELRHLWQGQGPPAKNRTEKPRPRKGMVYGARGRYSERDADAYALHKLRQWRRGELK